ncbi:MAG TPA: alpha-(1-_3)-arabinofuranosyltransferase [Dermatophilaceae bacterium]
MCIALTALTFHQSPGLVVPDTKLDMTADPGSFLLRALHLWDPAGAFGRLQDQAYGYLLPMGPFHWVLSSLGVHAWINQRLWWSLILCVAFVGVWSLARALRIGGPWAQLTVALLYALSPRILSEVSVSSIEVWPMAVVPWVLLPLVVPSPRTWLWRVSRSALAFALIGGVNAVATGAALILPTLWFLTRRADRRTVLAGAGWLGLVSAVSLWWFMPLLQLGRYGPPFLDWIEDAAVTTGTASVFESFRGMSAWPGFLAGAGGPNWPAGWQYVTTPLLITGTVVVATAGLVGLSLRSTPHRRFLVIGAAVGLMLLTLGHSGVAGSPLSGPLQGLLDGPLAPLRNTHKFELVLRLPLMLAAAQAMTVAGARLRAMTAPRLLGPVLVTSLVILVTAPAIVGGMALREGYVAIPAHWYQTADWLDHQSAAGTVLVVPAASFADFTWGSTKDEPLQALMRRPLAVRDALPLGSAGSTRMLDEIQRRLGQGMGGPDLQALLVRAGVRYVVVRDDLRLSAQGDPLIAVHQSLAESGISRVADFGPPAGSAVEGPAFTLDERTFVPYPSVEIFDVGAIRDVSVVPRSQLVTATAGPEDVAGLAALYGVHRAAVLGSDARGHDDLLAGAPHVLTDGQRRREVFFGRATHNTSQVLVADDPGRQGRRSFDYVSDDKAGVTTLQWAGVTSVRASSSASDANAGLRLGTAYSPGAAVDGDPGTRWVSGNFGEATGEWLEVTFTKAVDLRRIGLQLSADTPIGATARSVAVSTDRGTRSATVGGSGTEQSVPTPAGLTRRVRVTLRAVSAGRVNGFSIAELSIPGVTPVASLRLPPSSEGRVDAIVLRDQLPGRSSCLHVGDHPLCRASVALQSEEPSGLRRELSLPSGRPYTFSGEVLPRDGLALEKLLANPFAISATASSRAVSAPEGRPGAAVDTNLTTGWVASGLDRSPWLKLSWPHARRVNGVQLLSEQYLAASRPSRVRVQFDSGEAVSGAVDDQGYVRFPARSTRTLRIGFTRVSPVINAERATGLQQTLPVGVSEVRVLATDDLRRPVNLAQPTGVPCGFGPTLMVDGRSIPTRVEGTMQDLLGHQPLRWAACGSNLDGEQVAGRVALAAGAHAIAAGATGEFEPLQMIFTTPEAAAAEPAAPVAASLQRSDPSTMQITVGPRSQDSVVMVAQNFNAGWTARDGQGNALASIRLDGWKQGWVLPGGPATVVTARFMPDALYRRGLLVGLLALIGAVTLVPLSRRRLFGRGGREARGKATIPVAVLGGVQREAPGEAKIPAPVAICGGAVGLAFLAGWVGVTAGVVAGLLVLGLSGAIPGLRRRSGAHLPALIMALGLAAGLLAASQPWLQGSAGLHSGVVQFLTLLAFAVACVAALWDRPSVGRSFGGGERSKWRSLRPSRMMGRSTRR